MPVTGGINWTEIAGAFGVGAIASAVVTTYGGKGRERRKARSKALARLEKIEITRRTLPGYLRQAGQRVHDRGRTATCDHAVRQSLRGRPAVHHL
jgi:hypothetical protein